MRGAERISGYWRRRFAAASSDAGKTMARRTGGFCLATLPGDRTARRRDQAHGGAQRVRLAGTVGSDQHGRCAGGDGEGDTVEHHRIVSWQW